MAFFSILVARGAMRTAQMTPYYSQRIVRNFISNFLLEDIPWEGDDTFEEFKRNCAEAWWQRSAPLTSLYFQMFALKFYEGYQLIMQFLGDLAAFYC